MARRCNAVSLVVAAAAVALTACSASGGVATVSVHADYPAYDTAGLIEEATLVVAGTALSARSTLVEAWYEGEDPEANPLAGLPGDVQEIAAAELVDAVATAVTFRADVVYQGTVAPGQEITVLQTGGVLDGVTYEVASETPLEVDQSYLLFATHGRDDSYVILGGSAGVYSAAEGGSFTATAGSTAPADRFTPGELAALTAQVAQAATSSQHSSEPAHPPAAEVVDDADLCTAFGDVLTIVENADLGLADGRMEEQEHRGWYALATRVLDRLPSNGEGSVRSAIADLQTLAPAVSSGTGTEPVGIRSAEWYDALETLGDACDDLGAPLAISVFTGG